VFGSRAIADLATDEGEVELLDWLISLREHPSQRDGAPIASRTVRNIASCVRVFFADAAERKVVRRNPAPAPELFMAAGVAAADGAARAGAPGSALERILRRAVDQAAALRGETA